MAGSSRGVRLAALAFAQIVAWGVLYYSVLVAAPAIANDIGWNDGAVFIAITLGLPTSAVCAVRMRRVSCRPGCQPATR